MLYLQDGMDHLNSDVRNERNVGVSVELRVFAMECLDKTRHIPSLDRKHIPPPQQVTIPHLPLTAGLHGLIAVPFSA